MPKPANQKKIPIQKKVVCNEFDVKREIRLEVLRMYGSDSAYTTDRINAEVSRLYQIKNYELNSQKLIQTTSTHLDKSINSNYQTLNIESTTPEKSRTNDIETQEKISVDTNEVDMTENQLSGDSGYIFDGISGIDLITGTYTQYQSTSQDHPKLNVTPTINQTTPLVNASQQSCTDEILNAGNINGLDPLLDITNSTSSVHYNTPSLKLVPKTVVGEKKGIKISKFMTEMNSQDFDEANDQLEEKYPSYEHGIEIQSDAFLLSDWNNEDILQEVMKHTGVDSLYQATFTNDIITKIKTLTIKTSSYDDYKLLRNQEMWPANSFGGTYCKIKRLSRNLELTIFLKDRKKTFSIKKLLACEVKYNLSKIVRVQYDQKNLQTKLTEKVDGNRFTLVADTILSYVSACLDGIFLDGIKYFALPVVQHARICDKCLWIKCRASKNNPCTAKPRCEKCTETTHRENECTKVEYCINCNVYGHRSLIDGDCILYAEKTYSLNPFLLPLLLGEGIKEKPSDILRNQPSAKSTTNNINAATVQQMIIIHH